MQRSNLNLITRRSFFDRSLKTSMAVALSTLVDVPFVIKRALAEGTIGLNGKKLLFIWMRGANDGLNSVVPMMDPSYGVSRPTIGITPDPGTDYTVPGPADFPIGQTSAEPTFQYANGIRLGNGFAALHPSLKFLAPVYNAGDLALIHRVAYPRQSRSHFDSQNYWENATPNNDLIKNGFLYRTMVESGLARVSPLTGISVQSSLPLILRGDQAAMTNLTDPTRYSLLGIPNNTNGISKATLALKAANDMAFASKKNREMLDLQYQNLNNTLDIFSQIDFSEAGNIWRDDTKTNGDTDWHPADAQGYYLFPTTNDKNGGYRRPDNTTSTGKYVVPTSLYGLFSNLRSAAVILNKTDAIVAGTEFGGFDTHVQQGGATGTHAGLNRGIGWALYALRKYFMNYADRAAWENVVIVTLSEFGRTTIENSSLGTDHAEASVMWVAGGAVKGYGKGNPSGVYNCSPSDPLPWVTGNNGTMFAAAGRYLRRATDYRQVFGKLIRDHLGATQPQLNRIITGYANPAENLLNGGTSTDGTTIRPELPLV